MNKLVFKEVNLNEALELQEITDIDIYFLDHTDGKVKELTDENLKYSVIIGAWYYILED